MSIISPEVAREWIDRWDRQQEGYLPDREERFTALIDTVVAGVGRPDPRILDLGCGPGSLSTRLLERLPQASVVAVDTDPLLLALGRAAHSQLPGLRFVDLDLGEPGWSGKLNLTGDDAADWRPESAVERWLRHDDQFDAAVSTTALHWLPRPQLRAMYAELATVLRSGGMLLNGDHFSVPQTPTIEGLDTALAETMKQRHFGDDRPEEWGQWWDAVLADPVLSGITDTRATSGHGNSESARLSTHTQALSDAGFSEVGIVWQHGDNRLLCGVRG